MERGIPYPLRRRRRFNANAPSPEFIFNNSTTDHNWYPHHDSISSSSDIIFIVFCWSPQDSVVYKSCRIARSLQNERWDKIDFCKTLLFGMDERGRPSCRWIENILKWCDKKFKEVVQMTSDKIEWRKVITTGPKYPSWSWDEEAGSWQGARSTTSCIQLPAPCYQIVSYSLKPQTITFRMLTYSENLSTSSVRNSSITPRDGFPGLQWLVPMQCSSPVNQSASLKHLQSC